MIKHILLNSSTLFLNFIPFSIYSSEIINLSFNPKSQLAAKSPLIKQILAAADSNNITIDTSLRVTQNTLDTLTLMYDNTSLKNLSEQSFDELVSLANLNAFLVPKENKSRDIDVKLNDALLDHIQKSKRPADLMALEHINPHVAEKLFNILSDKRLYRTDLCSFLSFCVHQAKKNATQLPWPGWLSFSTDSIKIFDLRPSQKNLLLQYDNGEKSMPLEQDDHLINIAVNGSCFIMHNSTDKIIKKYNIPTLQQDYLIEDITAYTDATNNALCLADKNGNIILYDYEHNTQTLLTKIDLQPPTNHRKNEKIIALQYHKGVDQACPIIAISTDGGEVRGRIFVFRNNTIFPLSIILPHPGMCMQHIHFNPTATKLFLFPKEWDSGVFNEYRNSDPVILIDLNAQNMSPVQETTVTEFMDALIFSDSNYSPIAAPINITWHNNYLVMHYMRKYYVENKIKPIWEYFIVNTNNITKKYVISLSDDTKTPVSPSHDDTYLIQSHADSTSPSGYIDKKIPFNINDMMQIISHVDGTDQISMTAQQKLLSFILTQHLIKKDFYHDLVPLNEQEYHIFSNYMPQKLQDLFSSKIIFSSDQPPSWIQRCILSLKKLSLPEKFIITTGIIVLSAALLSKKSS